MDLPMAQLPWIPTDIKKAGLRLVKDQALLMSY